MQCHVNFMQHHFCNEHAGISQKAEMYMDRVRPSTGWVGLGCLYNCYPVLVSALIMDEKLTKENNFCKRRTRSMLI